MQSKPSLISQYMVVGNIVYTSGVTSRSGDTPTQIHNCMERLKEILTEAGASLGTVVKATIYLSDLADREKYLNKIWQEYFPNSPPCRTTVQVGLGPDIKVEIEMVAERKYRSQSARTF